LFRTRMVRQVAAKHECLDCIGKYLLGGPAQYPPLAGVGTSDNVSIAEKCKAMIAEPWRLRARPLTHGRRVGSDEATHVGDAPIFDQAPEAAAFAMVEVFFDSPERVVECSDKQTVFVDVDDPAVEISVARLVAVGSADVNE